MPANHAQNPETKVDYLVSVTGAIGIPCSRSGAPPGHRLWCKNWSVLLLPIRIVKVTQSRAHVQAYQSNNNKLT